MTGRYRLLLVVHDSEDDGRTVETRQLGAVESMATVEALRVRMAALVPEQSRPE
jgi:hypothetical protein